MTRALAIAILGLGLFILLLSVAAGPRELVDLGRKEQALLFRQVGHEYLAEEGDKRSTIPPVEYLGNGGMLLRLEQDIDYDHLLEITRRVVARLPDDRSRSYVISLMDNETEEEILGSWLAIAPDSTGLGLACTERDQLPRCSNVYLRFTPVTEQRNRASFPWWMLGLLLMGYGGWLAVRPKVGKDLAPLSPTLHPAAAPLDEPAEATKAALSEHVSFDPTAQVLTIHGQASELTYREAQLLTYLSEHPNQVLKRQDIHDAVWGAEGLIVGRSLDVFVSRLRKKLKGTSDVEIQTVHGLGYRFRVR